MLKTTCSTKHLHTQGRAAMTSAAVDEVCGRIAPVALCSLAPSRLLYTAAAEACIHMTSFAYDSADVQRAYAELTHCQRAARCGRRLWKNYFQSWTTVPTSCCPFSSHENSLRMSLRICMRCGFVAGCVSGGHESRLVKRFCLFCH
jgi:hypothetical protein